MILARYSPPVLVVASLLLLAGAALAEKPTANAKPQGKPVTQAWVQLKDLPAAVQVTIKEAAKENMIVSLKKLEYKTETRFSARWVEGENLEIIHVAPDGVLLYHTSKPLDDDGTVDNSDDEYDGGC